MDVEATESMEHGTMFDNVASLLVIDKLVNRGPVVFVTILHQLLYRVNMNYGQKFASKAGLLDLHMHVT